MTDFYQKAVDARDRAHEAAKVMRDAKKNVDAAARAAINAATAYRSASRAALQAQEQNNADAEDAALFAVESRANAEDVLRQAACVFDSVDITENAKPHETCTHTTDAKTAIEESAAQAQDAKQNVHAAENDAKEAREKNDPVAAAKAAIAAVTAYQETRKAIRKGLRGDITYQPLSNIIGIVHVTQSATTNTLRIAADVLDKA